MPHCRLTDLLRESEKSLDCVIDPVVRRGYDDIEVVIDDYGQLIRMKEFQSLAVLGIYDEYFPPQRHEFELRLVEEFVQAVATFVVAAAASGIVGNAAYDFAKKLISSICRKMGTASRTARAFAEMRRDITRIERYFSDRKEARLADIEASAGIPRERLIRLLELLGFKCRGKRKRGTWLSPQ